MANKETNIMWKDSDEKVSLRPSARPEIDFGAILAFCKTPLLYGKFNRSVLNFIPSSSLIHDQV